MSKKADTIPQETIDLFKKLVDTNPNVEMKGASKLTYTSLNGNMYTMISKAGTVGLRLGKEEREAFRKKYNATLFETYGTIMKEYVAVPDDLLKKTDELKKYFNQSYEYAKTLKPKPTTKKKS